MLLHDNVFFDRDLLIDQLLRDLVYHPKQKRVLAMYLHILHLCEYWQLNESPVYVVWIDILDRKEYG